MFMTRYWEGGANRISDIASWRWVLHDLTKRLDESVETLQYEYNALRVVVQRIQDELDNRLQEGSKPGVLVPLSDSVEEAILQEYNFLRIEKKNFEQMMLDLDKLMSRIQKTRKRLSEDIMYKERTICIEESCVKDQCNNTGDWRRKRNKGYHIVRWEKRCACLKRAGLRALSDGVLVRQQVRGARVQLSIGAQAYAAKVDAVLRRRLNTNKVKLHDLVWQKEEAIRDLKSLDDELAIAEENLMDNMHQERLIEARLAERARRPGRELIKDDVDKQLRKNLCQFKEYSRQFINNIERITKLQRNLMQAISQFDCFVEDISQVVILDEFRIRARSGEDLTNHTSTSTRSHNGSRQASQQGHTNGQLTAISEEDEDDDYPFDD